MRGGADYTGVKVLPERSMVRSGAAIYAAAGAVGHNLAVAGQNDMIFLIQERPRRGKSVA